MHPSAGGARYGFERIFVALGWIVGNPALHVPASVGATVEEGFHPAESTN